MNYKQCVLTKRLQGSTTQTKVSWIPECFARVGETLRLKNHNDIWDDGWIVTSVGASLPAKLAEANSRLHLKQRKASDVVFSKIKQENIDNGKN